MDMSQEAFIVRKFRGKMPDAYPGASILCEPAQVAMHMGMSQEAFCGKNAGKMSDATDTTSIEHRA